MAEGRCQIASVEQRSAIRDCPESEIAKEITKLSKDIVTVTVVTVAPETSVS